MVLEYIPMYRLSQEKLQSHLEEVFGHTIVFFYVSDAYHMQQGQDDFYVVDVPQSLTDVRVIGIRDGKAGTTSI